MANNKLANLKSQLQTSGLSRTDQPLFQVINQLIQFLQDLGVEVDTVAATASSGGSPLAITGLTTDVIATGPGNVVATIQPAAVTYAKIQNVTALRLVGNPSSPAGVMVEIPLGDNLAFVDGALVVQIEPGTDGLFHRLLSLTHLDTVPATPILGDLIYATAGPTITGEYYGFILNARVVENFVGIRAGYMSGYHGNYTPTNSMGYAPPELAFIPVTPPNSLLSIDYTDFFLLARLVENFTGLRVGYQVITSDFVIGNNYAYYPPELAFIAPPNPINPSNSPLWTRRAIGTTGQVLTVTSGLPQWQDLPPIPDEPEYPWQDITFAAGDFTAAGGTTPTWTVALGDVARWQYQQFPGTVGVGNNVRIALYVKTTSVGGTAPTKLQITIPFNIIGEFAQFISIRENSASVTNTYIYYDDSISTNTLYIEKIGGGVFDTTANETYLSFEISATLAP
jgi:hypothetical protein